MTLDEYRAEQAKAPGCLLLFRVGDFYEFVHDDAAIASALLGLTVSQKQGAPMCGFPYHQLDGYLRRLLVKGQRVAIFEQTPPA